VIGLEKQEASKKDKSTKPLCGADHDIKTSLSVGYCKDPVGTFEHCTAEPPWGEELKERFREQFTIKTKLTQFH
jgi:hypothetical protein